MTVGTGNSSGVPESAERVMAYWADHRALLRHSEEQRAVLTNYILVIAAALTGLIVQQGAHRDMAPAAALIVLIGAYGALTSAKYHERSWYHLTQARALTAHLVASGHLPNLDTPLSAARDTHRQAHPVTSRIRLHLLWTGLHLALTGYGTALFVLTLTR